MNKLIQINRLILAKKVVFTAQAGSELEKDGLLPLHVMESIINAPAISKRLKSANPRTGEREQLYVIVGQSYAGTVKRTIGKIRKEEDEETFYILSSSKRSVA